MKSITYKSYYLNSFAATCGNLSKFKMSLIADRRPLPKRPETCETPNCMRPQTFVTPTSMRHNQNSLYLHITSRKNDISVHSCLRHRNTDFLQRKQFKLGHPNSVQSCKISLPHPHRLLTAQAWDAQTLSYCTGREPQPNPNPH